MDMTPPARMEVENLQRLQNDIERKEKDIYNNENIPWDLRRREANRLSNKRYQIEDKIRGIKELGISTGEKRALSTSIRSGGAWTKIKSERDLSGTTYSAIGRFLGKLVRVQYTKWSSFMSNVKGMGSYAGKTDIVSISEISPEDYNSFMKQERTSTVSFMGKTETTKMGVSDW
jgi:hypothetical protein